MKMKKIISFALAIILTFALAPVMATKSDSTQSDYFVAVSAGGNHSMAIKSDGSLWVWGKNARGQLGDGTTIDRVTPIKIMDDVIAISAGGNHSMAIKSDGSLWAWGLNEFGQLGAGTMIYYMVTPVKIMDDVITVSAGYYHSMVIKSDGSLWTWGNNIAGQLGNGWFYFDNNLPENGTPTKIMDDVIAVSAGEYHSLAITSDGSLWAWGDNSRGQLFHDTLLKYSATPIKVMDDVIAISAGGWTSSIIYIADDEYIPDTEKEKILYDVTVSSAGGSHFCVIRGDGSLWALGYNDYGQLGDGSMSDIDDYKDTPIKIMDDVIAISAGGYHSLAIKSDGSLWTWGLNDRGQLGDGTIENKTTPVKIMDLYVSATAIPTPSTVLVNGADVAFDAYNINGSN